MTKALRRGFESPFSHWLRTQPDLESRSHKLAISDADFIFRRSRGQKIMVGYKDVELIMIVELKTYDHALEYPQKQTLLDINELIRRPDALGRRKQYRRTKAGAPSFVLPFGIYVLRLDGTRPDNSKSIRWSRVDEDDRRTVLTEEQLTKVLCFDNDPDSPLKRFYPRHDINRPTRSADLFAIDETFDIM